MTTNYYLVLDISKDASSESLRSAYRKLAVKYHPDKNQNDAAAAERFLEITKAYETLSDPEKRRLYDLELSGKKPKPDAFDGRTEKATKTTVADALRVFMRNLRGDQDLKNAFQQNESAFEPTRGSNIQIHINLTLSEILSGVKKTIRIAHQKTCESCTGSGSTQGTITLVPCPQCAGQGKVRVVGNTHPVQCAMCGGSGKTLENPCPACRGIGTVPKETDISISFPAGIAEGNYITLTGMGNAGTRKGQPGDLVVFIEETTDDHFRRNGWDLETDVTVTLDKVVLGGGAGIVDLRGQLRSFHIEAGTQPEERIKLKELGLPVYKQPGVYGDLYVKIHVEIPKKLNEEEKKVFHEFLSMLKKSEEISAMHRVGMYYVLEITPDEVHENYIPSFRRAEKMIRNDNSVVLDISKISYLNSMTFGQLIKLHKYLKKKNKELIILGTSPAVMESFKACALDRVFTFYDNESALPQTEGEPDGNESSPPPAGGGVCVAGRYHVITVHPGEANNKYETAFKQADDFAEKKSAVALDVSRVKHIDSLTLGTMVKLHKKLKSYHETLVIAGASERLKEIFGACNIDRLFRFVSDVRELENEHSVA